MKKALIIVPIVVVVAAATVLGLFAAGIIGRNPEEPVAQAIEASASEVGVFKGLATNAYFDITTADGRLPGELRKYVNIHDNKGEPVDLKKTAQGQGVYRIEAAAGFKERSSYQIWVTGGASFVDEQYQGLTTFIFMTAGTEKEVVTINSAIKETTLAGTVIEPVAVNDETYYNVVLPSPVADHYQAGDVILAKKPAANLLSDEFNSLYTGDIANYAYNGMAAYYVLRTSETKDGKEEVYCRLAQVNEVVTELDVYKTLTIDENNFTVNEALLQKALDDSEFTAAVYDAAVEAFDMFSGSFDKTVKESPKMVATFEYDVSLDKIQLDFIFTITLAKGMDIVFAVRNTINITPNVNCDLDVFDSDFDLQLDLGVNLKTKTVCTIDMDTTDAKIQAKDMEDFKKKFKDLIAGKTAEKGIGGAELPIYSYKYPIYCFVLGIEFGVDIDLGIKAQVAFEYDYLTDITVGVTYVNGEIGSYKSIETSSSAKDLVLLGKIKAEAGVYVKLTASLLEVAGVGFKVKTGAYAEIGGQVRLDMQAALEDHELRVLAGYYVTGGLYLALGFEVKAGLTLPVIGWKGWEKYWEPARWEFPLFEFGSKYIVDSFVESEMTVDIQGKTYEIGKIKVNAFDLDKVADANNVEIGMDAFNVEYIDGAENFITYENGRVTVSPTVGTAFEAKIRITPKSGSDASATITFRKAAVQPTCEETSATFDSMHPADVVFDVKKNQSDFIELKGENIAENNYAVSSEGALTIYSTFLSGLSVGDHTFTYVTDKGRVVLTLTVINSTPIAMKSGGTVRAFLKSGKANVTFPIDLKGNKVTAVEGLNKGEYNVDSTGTLSISGAYLMTKEDGTYTYVVKANNNSSLNLTVTVEDDRVPELLMYNYSFAKNSCTADVKVSYVSYKYVLESVTGNGIKSTDYSVQDGTLTIKKDYLAKQTKGVNEFSVNFKRGNATTSRSIYVDVKDDATIIAVAPAATFDKNDPKEAEFTVLATSAVTLSGNAIDGNYTVSGAQVKIAIPYLQNRAVGTYVYTATAGGATATLTLEVIDTAVPEFTMADGGVKTLKYDKKEGANKEKTFTILLPNDATFGKVDGNGITKDDYYTVNKAEGTEVTLSDEYVSALPVGTYEFSVLTNVNVSTLVLEVSDTSVPKTLSSTSLTYQLGTNEDRTVTFANYEHGIKAISVTGGDAISLFSGDCTFDVSTGVFTLKASYLETIAKNTYVTVFLTFDDEAETALSITLAVN